MCFPQFEVTVAAVGSDCVLTVKPDALASTLKYGQTTANGAWACPTASLSYTFRAGDSLNDALTRALFKASFSVGAITSAAFSADGKRLVVDTPSADNLVYFVASGSLGATVSTAATSADACNGNTDCAAATCAADRYKNGPACALCPAGHSCTTTAKTPCAAGKFAQFVGDATCSDCDIGTYSSTTGNSHCAVCPAPSTNHFAGSTSCLACYFGTPKVLAGAGAEAVLPTERPAPGYRVYTLAGNTLNACAVDHPFKTCTSVNQRSVAVATDESCLVRVFVLGDSACSVGEDLAIVSG